MTSSLCLVGHVALEPRDFLLCAAAVRMRASKSSPGGSNDRAVGKEVGGVPVFITHWNMHDVGTLSWCF